MDLIHFMYVLAIILFVVIAIILYYNWKIRKEHKTVLSNTDSAEVIINDISKILNNVEKQLSSINDESFSFVESTSRDSDIKDYKYMIEIAKAEVDKSNLLMDKLSHVIANGSIEANQLNKLSTINTQIRNINSTLSNRFEKTF